MGRHFYFKAITDKTIDVNTIWREISRYHKVNLGDDDGRHYVYFDGSIEDGLKVMARLLEIGDVQFVGNVGF